MDKHPDTTASVLALAVYKAIVRAEGKPSSRDRGASPNTITWELGGKNPYDLNRQDPPIYCTDTELGDALNSLIRDGRIRLEIESARGGNQRDANFRSIPPVEQNPDHDPEAYQERNH